MMDLKELRKEAAEQGYRLVHQDCIRTATVSEKVSKLELYRYKDSVVDVVNSSLRRAMSDFMIRHRIGEVSELPHEFNHEYRMDITFLTRRSPDPEKEWFYYPHPMSKEFDQP